MLYSLEFERVSQIIFALTALDRRNHENLERAYIIGRDQLPALREAATTALHQTALSLYPLVEEMDDEAWTLTIEIANRLPRGVHLMISGLLEEAIALKTLALIHLCENSEVEARYSRQYGKTIERLRHHLTGSNPGAWQARAAVHRY